MFHAKKQKLSVKHSGFCLRGVYGEKKNVEKKNYFSPTTEQVDKIKSFSTVKKPIISKQICNLIKDKAVFDRVIDLTL